MGLNLVARIQPRTKRGKSVGLFLHDSAQECVESVDVHLPKVFCPKFPQDHLNTAQSMVKPVTNFVLKNS